MAHDAKVGACFLGTYSRLKDAVESVSNFTQTPHSELRLTRKSRQEPPHVSMERFCIMEQAFGDFVPPDIVSARYWRVHGDQTMPMLAPGLQVLSLMAKEDPWRFELDLSWRNTEVHARMCVSGATGSGHEQDRACRLMHKILSACTLSWFKKHASARQFWTEHNLGVAHHSSLLTMLKNCKMLAICSSGTLKWQEDGTRYVLVLYDADVHVPVFTSTHKLGTILRMAPIPCTLSALQKSLAMTRSMVAASGLESWLERPYKFPWLCRAHLLVEQAYHKIPHVTFDRDLSVSEAQDLLQPDEDKWLVTWSKSLRKDSLRALVQHLGYKGPLELLSCKACFYGADGIRAWSPEILRAHLADFRRMRNVMRKRHGFEPAPRVVVAEVMQRAVSKGAS